MPSILIVDDTSINLNLMAEAVSDLADISLAQDGETAIKIAKKTSPELILLDVDMPNMNGFEVCHALQSIPALATTSIIFVTVLDDIKTELHAFGLGGIDFIGKPFNRHKLRARVQTHLSLVKRTKDLIHTKNELSQLLHSLPCFVSQWDSNFRNQFNNDTDSKWFADGGENLQGKHLKDVLDFNAFAKHMEHFDQAQNDKHSSFLLKLKDSQGIQRHVQADLIPVKPTVSNDGFLMVLNDITMSTYQTSIENQAKLSIPDKNESKQALIAVDTKCRVTFINSVACELIGCDKDEVAGKDIQTLLLLLDSVTLNHLENPVVKAVEQKQSIRLPFDVVVIDKQKKKYYIEIAAFPLFNGQDELIGAVAAFNDISQINELTRQISNASNYDSLTKLPNRSLLMERVEQTLVYAQDTQHIVALIILDIDNFHNINSTLGFVVGDQLLIDISQRIKQDLSTKASLFRSGGDEFTILVNKVDGAEDIALLCTKILSYFEEIWNVNGQQFSVTVSLGASMYPNDSINTESLYRNAEIALHEAKLKGRNNYRFFDESVDKALAEFTLRQECLIKALDDNELEVHYQPVINGDNFSILGAEALIRWRKSNGDMVFPGEFIPLAESTNLIIPIGAFVLKTACLDAVKWQEQNPQFFISVNISAIQFNPSLVITIQNVLDETGIPPHTLILEITESILLNDQHSIDIVQELKTLGIQFAMDDFGTGYSSLSYLKKFPIDKLKIDQSFVKNMVYDDTDSSIVETLVNLSSALNIDVVAEGVETKQQANMLVAMQCNMLQGYFFGRPVPKDDFSQLLLEYKSD